MSELLVIPKLAPIKERFKATSTKLNGLIETCIAANPPADTTIMLSAGPPLLAELSQHKDAALEVKKALDTNSAIAKEKMDIANKNWVSSGNNADNYKPEDQQPRFWLDKLLLVQDFSSRLYQELARVDRLLADIDTLAHTTCTILRRCHDDKAKVIQALRSGSSQILDEPPEKGKKNQLGEGKKGSEN